MMAKEFQSLTQKYDAYLSNYLDDWIIATPEGAEGLALHHQITHKFLDLIECLSYFLNFGKCKFKCSSVEFLGWLVTSEGVVVDPSKAAGLAHWPHQLWNVKEVRHTLGILGYQCPFIRGYAHLAQLLTELTKKGVLFHWKQKHIEALDALIKNITTTLVLRCPNPEKQYFLEVDASAFALGAVLLKKDEEGRTCDVAYFSKALTPLEWNYDVWDREFLAVVMAL
jgi:hypothetical protein